LTGNPLACQCQTVSTLHDVNTAVSGAECLYPVDAAGVTFSALSQPNNTYYTSPAINASAFQCGE